jgi:hypothetical protein
MQKRKERHSPWWPLGCCLLIAAAILQGCSQERAAATRPEDPVLLARKERDLAFKSGPHSPIPPRERAGFKGLDYFPINPELRFRLRLNRYPIPEHVRLGTNTGEIRDGLRYGYFEFVAEGQVCRLQAYRLDDSDSSGKPYLFIPFRDATTGKETYSAGRYLDLPENTSGIYDLDFNRATNPLCAYGEGYSCPIPPDENRLPIPIRAGEKSYPLAHNR